LRSHHHDDPILTAELVQYVGQPIFIVVADTHDHARRAARLAQVSYEELPAIMTPQAAKAAQSYVLPPMQLTRGNYQAAFETAPHVVKGQLYVGGQEQFYLEGQISYAIPKEAQGMLVLCSTQHPSEMQHVVAHALACIRTTLRSNAGAWAAVSAARNRSRPCGRQPHRLRRPS